MEIHEKIIPPMMILKYSTAPSWVSGVEPQSLIMGEASCTKAMLIITAMTMTNAKDVTAIRLASSLFFSPRRLATNAETATFSAKNMEKPMNFG